MVKFLSANYLKTNCPTYMSSSFWLLYTMSKAKGLEDLILDLFPLSHIVTVWDFKRLIRSKIPPAIIAGNQIMAGINK